MAAKGAPPTFVAPPPPPKKGAATSYNDAAVTRRLLATKQAKALGYQSFALWTNLANQFRIPAPELIAAAIATRTLPNKGSVGALAKNIRAGIGAAGSLQAFLSQAYPGSAPVAPIYKAANAPAGKYVPNYGQTPIQKAGESVATSAATTAIKNSNVSWVTYDPKTGKIGTAPVSSYDPISGLPTNPPKNGLYYGQTPVTSTVFAQALHDLSDHFAAYGPQKPNGVNTKDPNYIKQVAKFLYQGLTPTAIDSALAKQPGFLKSAAWKAQAPAIIQIAKSMFGDGWSPSKNPTFIRAAIVGNWSQATIQAKLKENPLYLKGPVYKQDTAALNNVHMSIMGTPNAQDEVNIHEAAMEGWSPDQYAAWVRSTDAYRYSPEAKSYSIGIAQALGLLTGTQGLVPVNAPGGAPQPQDSVQLPNNPKIAGTPSKIANTGVPAKPAPKPAAKPAATKAPARSPYYYGGGG